MSFNWKSRKLKAALTLLSLMGAGPHFAAAQTKTPSPRTQQIIDDARLMRYLDKNGGYKTKSGGYFNPKAGTYTDETGGVVDNWGGYTYKDGSYKSKLGDFWEAPTSTFKLSDGRVAKSTVSSADAIKALRDNVAANGGYDKDLTERSMWQSLRNEHPLKPAKPPQQQR